MNKFKLKCKKQMGLFLLPLWALCLLLPTLAWSQAAGLAGSYTRMGFGPRGMAAGNALTSAAFEGVYAYYNPALAGFVEKGNQVDLSTSLMSFDRTLNMLNATFVLPPSAGIAVGLINANVNNIDGRDPSGYPTKSLSTSEYQLLSAFGLHITNRLYAGLGLKFNLADFHNQLANSKSVGLDAGVVYRPAKQWHIGLAVHDLLSSYSWNSKNLYGQRLGNQITNHFPTRITLGNSYRFTEELLLAVTYSRLIAPSEGTHQLRVGSVYKLHPRMTLRAGWRTLDLQHTARNGSTSAGFSIHLPFDNLSPSVDYAFIIEPNQISSMHVFGMKFHL